MRRKKRRRAAGKVAAKGYRKLAETIGGFADIYERVEEAKQRQMVELEKQRMQFAKDLEIQRMKLFMESQVQFEKLKRSKCNSPSGVVSRFALSPLIPQLPSLPGR
nr:trihelix transcription factor ASIL2-like [Coffea arabica]